MVNPCGEPNNLMSLKYQLRLASAKGMYLDTGSDNFTLPLSTKVKKAQATSGFVQPCNLHSVLRAPGTTRTTKISDNVTDLTLRHYSYYFPYVAYSLPYATQVCSAKPLLYSPECEVGFLVGFSICEAQDALPISKNAMRRARQSSALHLAGHGLLQLFQGPSSQPQGFRRGRGKAAGPRGTLRRGTFQGAHGRTHRRGDGMRRDLLDVDRCRCRLRDVER